jgi:hypothetical protein
MNLQIGLSEEGKVVGVAIVGRPVSRMLKGAREKMSYQITCEIPDGDFCLKITDPYILCPLLVCDGDQYYCPFGNAEPMPEICGRTALSKGGVVKQSFCPSKKPVNRAQIDFWTFQKLGYSANSKV